MDCDISQAQQDISETYVTIQLVDPFDPVLYSSLHRSGRSWQISDNVSFASFDSCSGRVSTRDQLTGQLVLSLHADARVLRIASFPCIKPFCISHDVWLIGHLLRLFRSILSCICFFLECLVVKANWLSIVCFGNF